MRATDRQLLYSVIWGNVKAQRVLENSLENIVRKILPDEKFKQKDDDEEGQWQRPCGSQTVGWGTAW